MVLLGSLRFNGTNQAGQTRMSRFISVDRSTEYLLPPSVQDWLPENHLARFVVDVVERLDLSALIQAYAGRGKDAHHPAALLGLLIYGYATGVYHSRKIERATYESLAFRYIAANTHPDHDTIAAFRARFSAEISALFVQVLLVAREMKLVKLGAITVAVDGSKLKANASKHKALSWAHLHVIETQLKAEVAALMEKADHADANDLPDGMNLPAELVRRQDRLAALDAARSEIKRRADERDVGLVAEYEQKQQARQDTRDRGGRPGGREPAPPVLGPRASDQVSLTDADSRIMRSAGGAFEQAYNGQLAVDCESRLITAAYVTQAGNDKQQIEPMLAKLTSLPSELGGCEALLADTGYYSAKNVGACAEARVTPLIAIKREHHHVSLNERFAADPPALTTAPTLAPTANGADGVGAETALAQMRHALKTSSGRALYALRKSTVEPAIGVIKHVMGFRQFSVRGLNRVDAEWSLVTLAYNVKRMNVLRMA